MLPVYLVDVYTYKHLKSNTQTNPYPFFCGLNLESINLVFKNISRLTVTNIIKVTYSAKEEKQHQWL